MANLVAQLVVAARVGDVAGITALLAAGADVNGRDANDHTALAWAVHKSHEECVAALLAAGADPNAALANGVAPLHMAISNSNLACVELLAGAGADPLALIVNTCAVKMAAITSPALVQALLKAVPAAALAADGGELELKLLGVLLSINKLEGPRYLLTEGPLLPADEVLIELSRARHTAQPLFALLASRQPLTALQWEQVPNPCAGLAAALPAVLRRSTAEAALLVHHLPADDKERLRTAALCLGRAQRQADAPLPNNILWHLLMQSVADSAAVPAAPAPADAAVPAVGVLLRHWLLPLQARQLLLPLLMLMFLPLLRR